MTEMIQHQLMIDIGGLSEDNPLRRAGVSEVDHKYDNWVTFKVGKFTSKTARALDNLVNKWYVSAGSSAKIWIHAEYIPDQ